MKVGLKTRAALDKSNSIGAMTDEVECIKASIRAKVEHPFGEIKCQFGSCHA